MIILFGLGRKIIPLRLFRASFAVALVGALVAMAGCGGSSGTGSGGMTAGITTVVVMASSTANDQLTGFDGEIQSLTLTNKDGKQVTLISSNVSDDFIHSNGTVEPLVTVSVPQDTYVSATATVGSMEPLCTQLYPDSLDIDQMANAGAVVNVPSPITVTGKVMGLVLNLDVSKSIAFQGACPSATDFNTIPQSSSEFDLTPLSIAAEPTNSSNGMMLGLRGIIQSVGNGGSTLTVNALSAFGGTGSLTWTVNLTSSTNLQSGSTQLAAGAVIDMDAAVQQDGSFRATRVAVINAGNSNLSVEAGPVLTVYSPEQTLFFDGTYEEGYLSPRLGGASSFNYDSAQFQISGQIDNLADLPFSATFTAANMVAGQRALLSTVATSQTGGPNYTPSTQITLLPQTINGTITATSSEGSFTTYTVQLAPYDLFANLAVQPGQATLLTTPNTVVVYADSNTQMLNSGGLSSGSLARFYGLVFDDNGTLRMDCAQMNDGVAE